MHFLSQSAKILNENHDTEDIDASTTSKWDNRSPSPFDNNDTQREIVMAEKRNTSSITHGWQLESTGINKYIIEPWKVAPVDLELLKIS